MPNTGIINNLHPLEIVTLLSFRNSAEQFSSEILESTEITEDRLRMALEWLQKRELISIVHEKSDIIVSLTETSQELKNKKIIELRIIDILSKHGSMTIPEIAQRIHEENKNINIAVANLKKSQIVEIQKGGIVKQIKNADISEFTIRQQLIEQIAEAGYSHKDDFNDKAWNFIKDSSRKRGKSKGFFRLTEKIDRQFVLTPIGKQALEEIIKRGFTGEEISQLTPDILKDGSWKTKSFREYNIEGPCPRIVFGKKNPYRTFLDSVKIKLISLGFEEMRGPLVESEFWNMDALYMPQYHPARDIHDAYYIKSPTYCKVIKEPNYSNVSDTHTFGGNTDSIGWRYKFDKERTKRLVLRSQGTALSIRQLSEQPKIPGKYFALARCFRYDTVDSTHAPDFFQVEGIVLGKEINFKHLLGILKLFALEIAKSKEMKFVPAYFPFTEPSVEVHMKHPVLGWLELGGAGIFRPEVTTPQGIDVPVIAWGLGLDRMAMVALEIQDIRDLFSCDLNFIRSKRVKTLI
ncbi:MAG: phenylalanine--tRNA ligase subunit alpha [Candidatus Hodarchaeota archaeon]